jgi:hypothetical protein
MDENNLDIAVENKLKAVPEMGDVPLFFGVCSDESEYPRACFRRSVAVPLHSFSNKSIYTYVYHVQLWHTDKAELTALKKATKDALHRKTLTLVDPDAKFMGCQWTTGGLSNSAIPTAPTDAPIYYSIDHYAVNVDVTAS